MSLTALSPVSLDDIVGTLFAYDSSMRSVIAAQVGISLVQLSDILQGHVNPPAELILVLLHTIADSKQIV